MEIKIENLYFCTDVLLDKPFDLPLSHWVPGQYSKVLSQ